VVRRDYVWGCAYLHQGNSQPVQGVDQAVAPVFYDAGRFLLQAKDAYSHPSCRGLNPAVRTDVGGALEAGGVGAVYDHLAHDLQLVNYVDVEQPGYDQGDLQSFRIDLGGRLLIRLYQTGAVISLVEELAGYQHLLQCGPVYLSQLAARGPQIPEELKIGLLHLPVQGGAAAEEFMGGVQLLVNLYAADQSQGRVVQAGGFFFSHWITFQ